MSIVELVLGSSQRGTRIDRKVGNKAASIALDATVYENFNAPLQVTSHPVELGTDISDHVILPPKTLRVEGKISETPFSVEGQVTGVVSSVASKVGNELAGGLGGLVTTVGAAKTLAGVIKKKSSAGTSTRVGSGTFTPGELPSQTTRLRDAINEFMLLRDAKQPITIVTGLMVYENYLLTAFEVSRGTDSGGSIDVKLEFIELLYATSESVQIAIPKIPSALQKSNQGRKNAVPLEGEQKKGASLLLQGIRGVGSAVGL